MGKSPGIVGLDGRNWTEVTRTEPVISLRVDAAQVSADGWHTYDALYSRTGIQIYAGPEGSSIREYRSPDEVFATESLDSGVGVPWTLLHPERLLDPSSALGHARGAVLSVGRADDDMHTGGRIVAWDSDLIETIEGDGRQLSVGYRLKIDPRGGTDDFGQQFDQRQTAIRWNHLSSVPQGRAGSAAVKADAADAIHDLRPLIKARDVSRPIVFDFGGFARLDGLTATVPTDKRGDKNMSTKSYKIDGTEYVVPEVVEAALVAHEPLAAAIEAAKEGNFDALEALGVKLPKPEKVETVEEETDDDPRKDNDDYISREDADKLIAKVKDEARKDAAGVADALDHARRLLGRGWSPRNDGINDGDIEGLRRHVVLKALGEEKLKRVDACEHKPTALAMAYADAVEHIVGLDNHASNIRLEISKSRITATGTNSKDPVAAARQARLTLNASAGSLKG